MRCLFNNRLILALLSLMSAGLVSAQEVTLDVDATPLFEAANSFIPTWMTIFGVIAGISIAIAIVTLIIGKIVDALKGAM